MSRYLFDILTFPVFRGDKDFKIFFEDVVFDSEIYLLYSQLLEKHFIRLVRFNADVIFLKIGYFCPIK